MSTGTEPSRDSLGSEGWDFTHHDRRLIDDLYRHLHDPITDLPSTFVLVSPDGVEVPALEVPFTEVQALALEGRPKFVSEHRQLGVVTVWVESPESHGAVNVHNLLGSIRRRLSERGAIALVVPSTSAETLRFIQQSRVRETTMTTELGVGVRPAAGRAVLVFHGREFAPGEGLPTVSIRHCGAVTLEPPAGLDFLADKPVMDFEITSTLGFRARASDHACGLRPRLDGQAYDLVAKAADEIRRAGHKSLQVNFQGSFSPEFFVETSDGKWKPKRPYLAAPVNRLGKVLRRFARVRFQRFGKSGSASRPPQWVVCSTSLPGIASQGNPSNDFYRRRGNVLRSRAVENFVAGALGGWRNPNSGRDGRGDVLETSWFVEVKGRSDDSFQWTGEQFAEFKRQANRMGRPPILVVVFLDESGVQSSTVVSLQPDGDPSSTYSTDDFSVSRARATGEFTLTEEPGVWRYEPLDEFIARQPNIGASEVLPKDRSTSPQEPRGSA